MLQSLLHLTILTDTASRRFRLSPLLCQLKQPLLALCALHSRRAPAFHISLPVLVAILKEYSF
jgi:hypothetical protein